MQKTLSKAILAAATAGIALSPVVAEAKTRANTGGASAVSAPGANRSAKGQKIGGEEVVVGVLAVAAGIGAIIVASDGGSPAPIVPPPPPPASPGT